MNKISVIITEQQLRSKKVHLGAAFNPDNYIRIQNENLNEGALGLVLSIPAIIKIFRLCIDKGQEYWLKIFYKDLYDVIDHRTFSSLLNEDSIEDLVTADEGGYTKEQARKTFMCIKAITSEFEYASSAADDVSSVKTPHHHRSKEDRQKRQNRIELSGNNIITNVSEVLGALQHGLHHLYTSLSNLVGKTLVEAFESAFSNIKDEGKKQRIIDVIGNLFFVALITYALFFSGGSAISAMNGVKVLEIFAEACEICEIVTGAAILLPSVKTLIDKVLLFSRKFDNNVIDTCVNGLIQGSTKKVSDFFKKLEGSLNVEIHSSRFSPEMLSTKNNKKNNNSVVSDPNNFDYYGYPIVDNYIRQYIDLFLS